MTGLRKFFAALTRLLRARALRRWLHRRGLIYSPSQDLLDAAAAAMDAWELEQPRAPRPIEIHYVQRPPLPKVPTYIAYCCREYIAPYGFYGLRCVHCGQFPTYLREDTPEAAAAAAKAPLERERIVVQSMP